MNKRVLSFILNGEPFSCYTDIGVTLGDTLAHNFGGHCCSDNAQGVDIVLVDGVAINANLHLTLDAEGCNVYTFNGLCEHHEMQTLITSLKSVDIYDRCDCVKNLIMAAVPLLCETISPTRAKLSRAFNGLLCQKFKFDEVVSAIEKAYVDNMFRFIVKKSSPSGYRIETLDPKQTHKMTIMLPEAVGVDLAETPIKIASAPVILSARSASVQEVSVTSTEPNSVDAPVVSAPDPIVAPEIANVIADNGDVADVAPTSNLGEQGTYIEPQNIPSDETGGPKAMATPVSIFDEGFMDSMEKGDAVKSPDNKPKEKTGFFSKFTAAFRDRHHKTLELPDVEE